MGYMFGFENKSGQINRRKSTQEIVHISSYFFSPK